jgi:hypothetical protein
VVFPPYGRSNWTKLNRDYTVYVKGSPGVAQAFEAVFDGDSDLSDTFPSPVYEWDTQTNRHLSSSVHQSTRTCLEVASVICFVQSLHLTVVSRYNSRADWLHCREGGEGGGIVRPLIRPAGWRSTKSPPMGTPKPIATCSYYTIMSSGHSTGATSPASPP